MVVYKGQFVSFVVELFFSKCFIATAVYECPYAPEVMKLRKFRDRYLLKFSFGRLLVCFYYYISPFIANIIQKSDINIIIEKLS